MSDPVTLTLLADNSVMELLPDSSAVVRLSEPGRNFLAEHGFSALLTTSDGTRVLFDAGVTARVVPHNLSLLGLDITRDITVAVLSHGHADHTGCAPLLRCPVYAHPDVFGPRFLQRAGELRFDLTANSLPFLRERLRLHGEPVEVTPGVWTTGEVPRPNAWEEPRGFVRIRHGALEPDAVPDDQALVAVSEQGIIVVAGCAHAGIINTVKRAQEITGVARVRAVVGGFHLIDADDEKIAKTIAALHQIAPELLAPCHCTGFRASAALAQAFGDRFVYFTGGHRLSLS